MTSDTRREHTQRKEERLQFRLERHRRALLERSAQLEGQTPSAFVLQAALLEAERVVQSSQAVWVALETHQRFAAVLEERSGGDS